MTPPSGQACAAASWRRPGLRRGRVAGSKGPAMSAMRAWFRSVSWRPSPMAWGQALTPRLPSRGVPSNTAVSAVPTRPASQAMLPNRCRLTTRSGPCFRQALDKASNRGYFAHPLRSQTWTCCTKGCSSNRPAASFRTSTEIGSSGRAACQDSNTAVDRTTSPRKAGCNSNSPPLSGGMVRAVLIRRRRGCAGRR